MRTTSTKATPRAVPTRTTKSSMRAVNPTATMGKIKANMSKPRMNKTTIRQNARDKVMKVK